MRRDFPLLSKPIRIGNVTFRNRMFSAPMGGTDITNDGCIGPKSTAFYELRAKGGAGVVTVSECMVHPATDGSHAYHLDTSILNSLAAATYTADAIRRHGAIPSLELSHSGMFAGTYMTDKSRQKSMHQWGPSDAVRAEGVPVKGLTKELIDEIVQAYGTVAGLAKRAGFEMVMIHGGHGWLINQFLSPFFNKRTDEYGGSVENRCRFAIEVLKAVRGAVGEGFPIEFRMSGSELFKGGYDLAGGVEIAKNLEPYVDMLHVSAGSYQRGFGDTHPSMFKEHGCNVYLAAEIKKHVSVPVATIGGLNDPKQMEEILESGRADVVYMARALLADPFLPRKVMENRPEDIIRCLRCFTCMAERAATSTRRCTVNPLIGREIEGSEIYPAPVKKKVLVAGGGPGGLYAAYTAARRGHEVVLCEKSDEVGGILKSEQAIPFKREMYDLSRSYLRLCEQAGVEIRFNTEVTAAYVEAEPERYLEDKGVAGLGNCVATEGVAEQENCVAAEGAAEQENYVGVEKTAENRRCPESAGNVENGECLENGGAEMSRNRPFDAVIVAVGSRPFVPEIPGIHGQNVIPVTEYYRRKSEVGDTVVVLGGGLAGCECAIHLGMEGKKVHLVEMRDVLAPDANVRHRPLLLAEIEKYVTVHTGCQVVEISEHGVGCERIGKSGEVLSEQNMKSGPGKEGIVSTEKAQSVSTGEDEIVSSDTAQNNQRECFEKKQEGSSERIQLGCDSVICALGQRARTDVVESLRDAAPYVAVIGDAYRAGTITNAVYQGYHAALDI